jgi:Icc-related predicted phosphoesterase
MIQKLKNGKFRVRYDFGHNKFYRHLLTHQIKIEKRLEQVKSLKKTKPVEQKIIEKELQTTLEKISSLEREFGKPVNITTRRSFNCRNQWQAELVEKLFKDAHDYEAKGESIPDYLLKAIQGQQDAPYRKDFLEELGYQLASVSGNRSEVVENFSFSIFITQADINVDWLTQHQIQEQEVKKTAMALCSDQETIELKGKTFLYTGSFMGITACEDYVKALHRLAKTKKVDGIIVTGPWVKYIFLHKTAQHQKILNSVRRLAEDKIKIYAIRSNVESAELIPELKELGITFLTKIEDENNLFISHRFSRVSGKDQLGRFRDYSINKNLFVYTTYVAFEPILRKDKVRYIVGSGSSSFFTPTSRIWANSYDNQRINAEKYENIGGHILRFDDKGEVYPSSFYYDQNTKAIIVNGEVFLTKSPKIEKSDLHLIISDAHAKIMNRKAFAGLIHFIRKNRPRIKSISLNGDFFDNKLLSHHEEYNISGQIENKIKHKSFLHEVAHSRFVIDLILKELGTFKSKVKLYFKMGNHEVNSLKKITQKSITHFLDTMLDLETLLGLKDMGFEVIHSKKPYYIGQIPIYHGHEMRRDKASRVLGRESVCGHSHRGTIDNLGTILPTMQDASSADYLSYHEEPWTLGWAVLQEYKGHVTRPELILFKNDKFYDFEKIVQIDKPIKEEIPKILNISYKLD